MTRQTEYQNPLKEHITIYMKQNKLLMIKFSLLNGEEYGFEICILHLSPHKRILILLGSLEHGTGAEV